MRLHIAKGAKKGAREWQLCLFTPADYFYMKWLIISIEAKWQSWQFSRKKRISGWEKRNLNGNCLLRDMKLSQLEQTVVNQSCHMQEAAVLGTFSDADCLCTYNYTCIFQGVWWLPSWECFVVDLCDQGPVKLGFQCIKFFLWHIRIFYSHWRVTLGWHNSTSLEASSKDLCWIL